MDAKEQKIAEAALRLFYRHGYSKVTMLDIAEAAEMSRPTLYASFGNKESIFAALLHHFASRYEADAARIFPKQKTLKHKLDAMFDVWIIQPFASVIDSENGSDLLANCGVYAEEATAALYRRLEVQLAGVLKTHMAKRRKMTADDLAHILTTATKGLKATTTTLPEMRRMVEGLVTMAIATVGDG